MRHKSATLSREGRSTFYFLRHGKTKVDLVAQVLYFCYHVTHMRIHSYRPSFLRGVPAWVFLVAVTVVAILGVRLALSRPVGSQAQDAQVPHVQVASVSDLSAQAGPLSVVGTVTSASQAKILAQTSGEIVTLSRSIGDYVSAGAVIGSFENSSQRAMVMQAEGAYEAAQAVLSKARGATASNSDITSAQAATAADNASVALSAALKSAYASLDDAVHTKADALFTNPRGSSPTLISFTIPDSQIIIDIQNQRLKLDPILGDANAAAGASASDASAATVLAVAKTVSVFLDTLITGLNQAVPNNYVSASAIAADQASLAAARTEVVAAIASLTSAKGVYDSALSTAQTSSNSATSGTENDIAAAQASVKSAQGALASAQSNFEKTIIRSPIAGTIVSLPIKRGDYVSAFSPVAIVSNPGALYVHAQITSDDAKTLSVGNVATVDGSVRGTISFVAPALDPATGKIEVKVAILGSRGLLTDGSVVSLLLGRNKTTSATAAGSVLTIPIVALKITPAGPTVFSVTASSTLTAHSVVLGSILGDRVVIVSGLMPTVSIVTDARGLSEGERVVLDASAWQNATTTP